MRNLIALILLSAAHSSYSQVWIDSNATWHYDFEDFSFGPEGFYKYYYSKDTVIQGKLCQEICSESYHFYTWPTVDFVGVYPGSKNYTYASNDTIYYLNNGEFFVLYDFGANIGDSWIISTTLGSSSCGDTSRVEVIDTGSVIINSQSLRTITLQPMDSSSYGLSGVFNEKFGLMSSNLPWHLFPRYIECDTNIVVEWYYIFFKCFEDDSFSLYNPSGEDCEYLWTHLEIEDQLDFTFNIFPNPTNGNLTISAASNDSFGYRVEDIYGREIISKTNVYQKSELDLSEQKSGIYLVIIEDEFGGRIVRKVVKR